MTTRPHAEPGRGLATGLLLLGVLLVAANLRAVLTAVGPVLPEIGADLEIGATRLGLLVSLPIFAFAAVSPLVHAIARRHGVTRTVLVALLVLLAGTLLRSVPNEPALWIGTAVIGAGIAVGNVLLPVVVRQDFPDRVPSVTGYYIAAQSVVAGAASGLAVPIAELTGAWEIAVGAWVVLIAFALVSWLPRMRGRAPQTAALPSTPVPTPVPTPARMPEPAPREVPLVWRSGLAWQVAAYFGLQSTAFYVLVSWLPTVEQDLGVAPATAGWHLSVFLAVGIVANLAAPFLMRLGGDQRVAAVTTPVLTVVAVGGLAVAPGLVALWVALAGMAVGGSMVVALSLITVRSGDATAGSRLSSMVQSVGYLGVACGLVVAGVVRDLAGPGSHLLLYVGVVAAAQLAVGLSVGRNRVLGRPPGSSLGGSLGR